MERRRIIINFKNTPEEIALYESIKNRSSISGYIKDILKGLGTTENIKVAKSTKKTEKLELNEGLNDILNDL